MKALLIIDVQIGYIEKYDACLLGRINQRIQNAALNQELIVYVKNVSKLRSGTQSNALANDLAICSPYIMIKETASAFTSGDLLALLQKNHVDEIEIVGIDGNSCVAGTAVDARKHGYRVVLPCAYIGVKNVERFEKRKQTFATKGIVVI